MSNRFRIFMSLFSMSSALAIIGILWTGGVSPTVALQAALVALTMSIHALAFVTTPSTKR
jgi:uncharacterized membrane protein YkgB